MEALLQVVIAVGVLAGVLMIAPGLIFLERRLLALFQDRIGPNRVGPVGSLQLVADMIKILSKEDWTPPFADRATFLLAPAIVILTTMMSFAVISYSPGLVVADLDVGLLFFLGMSSLAVYGSALAGWASNSKYPLVGSMRAVGQMISYEVFMGLSLMGVVMLAGSFRFSEIVAAQQRHVWFFIPQLPGLLIFLTAGMAEMRRTPFDLPEAESELVAGYHTEYSSMQFAMFFLGEYVGHDADRDADRDAVLRRLGRALAAADRVVPDQDVPRDRILDPRPRGPAAPAIRPAHVARLEAAAAAGDREPAGHRSGSAAVGR